MAASSSTQPSGCDFANSERLFKDNRGVRKRMLQMLEHAKDLKNKTNNQMTKIEEWMEGQMDDRSARYVGKRIFSLADPRYSLGNVAKDDPHPVQHVNIRNDLYRDKEIGYGKNWKPPDDESLLIFMKEALKNTSQKSSILRKKFIMN